MVSSSSSSPNNNNNKLPAGVQKTIESIKEIVGNHSEADIYNTLKESNMDPNETADKLLLQDPFHEVKRKRDKKKEVPALKDPVPVKPRDPTEQPAQGTKSNSYSDRNPQRAGFVRNVEGSARNSEGSARNRENFARNRENFVRNRENFVRNRENFLRNREGYARNSERFARNNEGFARNSAPDSGVSRQFRVVRDNRIKRNENRETEPPAKSSDAVPAEEPQILKASDQSPAEASKDLKSPSSLPVDSLSIQEKGVGTTGSERNDRSGGKKATVSNVTPPVPATKPHDSQQSSVTSPNSSVVGVYSSSSDPVHIPSLASRPAANVGAIKREVGAVGARRHASEKSVKENSRSSAAVSKSDQSSHSNVPESAPIVSTGRSVNNSRSHQPVQKVSQANKEWKPKSGRKSNVTDVGVIGTPKKSKSSPAKNSKVTETAQLQDKSSLATTHEDQNVIIAAHIRVSETDRCRLTFGTLGIDVESPKNSGYQEARLVEESHLEPLPSSSVSPPDSSANEPSGSKLIESLDERVQVSGSVSPASEQQSTDRLESSSSQNIDNYNSIGLVTHSSPSYTPPEPQQQQGPPELPSFSQAYDPQTGYDMSFYRPASDESSLRAQVLQMPQEAYSSHMANNVPATTIPMVQQPQMYPQVHVPHYAMPFRQFISPVYGPPMVMPNYSNNPTYSPHPSTGNSYVLMPGVNSPHVNANGLKYAIPQFKSIQGGSPTGFGNFASPNGYTLSPGVVGSASGLDDTSRLKYKDGNVYVPNPQAETSELWMNPRDMPPSMQSASYYNMAGQTPHGAYLQPSHGGHASFNAAAQSSHMQFPGMYHPSQPGGIGNPQHHMGPTMGGNVGVAPGAPGSQIGGYQQQPQLSQMSWTGNF